MNKRILVVFIIWSLTFIYYYQTKVVAQGSEFQRVRSSTGAVYTGGGQTSLSAGRVPLPEYFIAIGDKMEVFVWQNSDLTKDVTVGPDGRISYPLVGRIQAAGLSIGQLEEEIKQKLSKYVRYPEVSIMMKEFAGNKVIVLGEVEYPGMYTYTGSIDLIEAIALAGDFTEKAQQDSVIVVRGNLTENPEVMRINVAQALKRGTSQIETVLQPNDVIYVSRSFIHDLGKFVKNFRTLIDDSREIMELRQDIMSRAITNY